MPGSGRAPDSPFVRDLVVPQAPPDRFHRPTATRRGSSVWAGCFLQAQHVDGLVCHGPLEPRVLLLEFVKLLGQLRIDAAVTTASWRCRARGGSTPAGKSPAGGRHPEPSHPFRGPRQPLEACRRFALRCITSSFENPFHPQAGLGDAHTRVGPGSGEGGQSMALPSVRSPRIPAPETDPLTGRRSARLDRMRGMPSSEGPATFADN